MKRFSLRRFPLKNRTILLRVDYNTHLEKGKIVDNSKIVASLPTIRYLLKQNCKIILMTHLGRPKGKIVASLKVNPLAQELQKLLPQEKITKLNDCLGKKIKDTIVKGKSKEIFFLENLRFYKEEEQNDFTFAHSLAELAEVYINDAFAVCHRKHASIDAITRFLPAISGFLLEKELLHLQKVIKPKKPAVWIIGGAKFDKIDLISQAFKKADYILIGGALAFPFLRAKGIPTGMSKIDSSAINKAKKILRKRKAKKIVMPVDFVVAKKFSSRAATETVAYNDIDTDQIALDLGPETIKLFKMYLRKAHTIFWNGPLGYFEWGKFAQATTRIGHFIGSLTATSVCGGGETISAVRKFHLEHDLDHLSTGGGATLTVLTGKKLSGIVALEKNYQKWKKRVKLK